MIKTWKTHKNIQLVILTEKIKRGRRFMWSSVDLQMKDVNSRIYSIIVDEM